MTALTDSERLLYQSILYNIEEGYDTCLIRSRLDGQEVAVIAGANSEANGDVVLTPLAILVTDDLFARLEQP